MEKNYKKHLIHQSKSIKEALPILDELAASAVLFVIDDQEKLIGSLTDGDIRRALIKGVNLKQSVSEIIRFDPKSIKKYDFHIEELLEYRKNNLRIIPIINEDNRVINVINFEEVKSYLPIDVVIMAGGKGTRLRPLTENTPKPLLKVGDKPIMEHNIDRLGLFGMDNFWISVNYLGEQIEDYFETGKEKNIDIKYVWEEKPLGTIGSMSKINDFKHDYILLTNSDILTNLDYEDFFLSFLDSEADLSVVTIPYDVKIPYAVLETDNDQVLSFKEKPTYTYYSNGGIYLIKKEILDLIPKDAFFNATDLMETLIEKNFKVHSYPLRGYWLDIGKHEDFEKAQNDITKIKF